MGYIDYNNIEDLIFNQSFINWVIFKTPESAAYWQNWLNENPHKLKLINDSKAIIYALQINFDGLSEEEIKIEIQKILEKRKDSFFIRNDYNTQFLISNSRYGNKKSSRFFRTKYVLPAFIFIVLIFGLALIFRHSLVSSKQDNTYSSLSIESRKLLVKQVNNSDTAQLLLLPDGSKVYLQKKTIIEYTPGFLGGARNVYLAGEAFFEVKKNPSNPFVVFTKRITAKVLGTSFWVRAYEADKDAVVTVKTGKVSVFKTAALNEKDVKEKELKGVIVTPNQKIIYAPETNGFTKSLTELPAVVAVAAATDFSFDATPVNKVFQTLQDAYMIPIIFDQEIISSCSLSANLGKEPFFEKLNIICRAINASYEMIDGNIIITAKGCK